MPSLRARFVNRLLRMTTKPVWRPGLDIHQVREHTARMEARLVRRGTPTARSDQGGHGGGRARRAFVYPS